jgi:hypothetical protein
MTNKKGQGKNRLGIPKLFGGSTAKYGVLHCVQDDSKIIRSEV